MIWGDGSKSFVLEDAGVEEMDMVVAMTAKDEDNYVICKMCKQKYGTAQTAAMVEDLKKKDFFYQMGIDQVIGALDLISELIDGRESPARLAG